MKYWLLAFAGIVVMSIGAYAVYAGYAAQRDATVNDDVRIVGPNFSPPPSRREDGFLEYKNLILHFDLFYPPELRVTEYDDGTAASTITFEAAGSNHAFQIFAVPYAESTITKEQVEKDVPSGMITGATDIVVDGSPAVMFFSTDPRLGEMREVWFIHNGFLYEINTIKENDEWLSQIMATWTFL